MKSLPAFIFLLSVAAFANASTTVAPTTVPQKQEKISQEEVGVRLIHELTRGDTESVSKYFEDSVKVYLTQEVFNSINGQITWLSRLIGDTVEQFMTGTQIAKNGETAFFREYRLANESNKRAPLIVIHLWFKDSTFNLAAGGFVKTFLENSEKRLDGDQTWKIDGKNVDIHSVVLIDFNEGGMLAVKVYDDEDTTDLDSNRVNVKGVPIAKEAIARGLVAKAKEELKEKKLVESIGVAFIRKDPHFGYTHYKYGISSSHFKAEWDSVSPPTLEPVVKSQPVPKAPSKKKAAKAK